MNQKLWYLYIIRTEKNRLYTGISTDPLRRFIEHLTGDKGAKFFRSDSPLDIEYLEVFENRSQASQREAAIKKLSRAKKLKLLDSFSSDF
ncbi:MAG: GIY-YIG nuclease family protein [Bacteriovoracaceae bacterium]